MLNAEGWVKIIFLLLCFAYMLPGMIEIGKWFMNRWWQSFNI